MKIKLVDTTGKKDAHTISSIYKPQKGEMISLDDGNNVEIRSIYQNDNLDAESPQYIAIVEYIVGKPVSEMTNQDVLDWFKNPESGLLDDDYEKL